MTETIVQKIERMKEENQKKIRALKSRNSKIAQYEMAWNNINPHKRSDQENRVNVLSKKKRGGYVFRELPTPELINLEKKIKSVVLYFLDQESEIEPGSSELYKMGYNYYIDFMTRKMDENTYTFFKNNEEEQIIMLIETLQEKPYLEIKNKKVKK